MGARMEGWSAGSFILGLVAWYGGGSDALDRLLVIKPLLFGAAGLAALAFALGLVLDSRPRKEAATTGAVLAVGLVLLGLPSAALTNRYADGSVEKMDTATVVRFRSQNKGPRLVVLAWRGREVEVQASRAVGCTEKDEARLEVRAGALGLPWVASMGCEPRR
jgi:hypothetical protein